MPAPRTRISLAESGSWWACGCPFVDGSASVCEMRPVLTLRRRGGSRGSAARPGRIGRRGWAGGQQWSSSGPPIRSADARTALKAGIRDSGSRAGSVSAFALDAPPQWNGTNTVSGRISSVDLGAEVRPGHAGCGQPTMSSWRDAAAAGQVGVHLHRRARPRWVSARDPPGLGAALVLGHQPAGGQHVRVARGPAPRPAPCGRPGGSGPGRPGSGKRSTNSRGVPGWSSSVGHGQKTPCSASIRS